MSNVKYKRFFQWPHARKRWREEMGEELAFHREQLIRELLLKGMPDLQATAEADRRLGNIDNFHNRVDRMAVMQQMREWLTDLFNDLLFAGRLLNRTRTYTCVALITLGLGIGANFAVFNLFNEVVLQALPYPESDRLVRVWPEKNLSIEMAEDIASANIGLETFASYSATNFTVKQNQLNKQVLGAHVRHSFFKTLGVDSIYGRTFTEQDSHPGAMPVLVVSFEYWRNQLGARQSAIGELLHVNGTARQVVGVMPRDHHSLYPDWQLWVPYEIDSLSDAYNHNLFLAGIGRLSAETDQQAVQTAFRTFLQAYRVDKSTTLDSTDINMARVHSLRDHLLGDSGQTLNALMFAVLLVMLVAVANVANLTVARVLARHREFAVRRTIGCNNQRLARQLLAEQLLLGLLASLISILFMLGLSSLFADQLIEYFPNFRAFSILFSDLLYIAGVTFLVSMGLGLTSLAVARGALALEVLHSQSGGNTVKSNRINQGLLIGQTAFSLLLVVIAGLMAKSFWQLSSVDPGFAQQQRLSLRIHTPSSLLTDSSQGEAYYQQLLTRVRALPGVQAADIITYLPLTSGDIGVYYQTPGMQLADGHRGSITGVRVVSEGYFQTMGIQLLQGRDFKQSDTRDSQPVAIINAALLSELPQQNMLGRSLLWDTGGEWALVIGVVSDVKQHQLSLTAKPETYLYYPQGIWTGSMDMVIKTSLPIASITAAVHDTINDSHPDALITRVARLEDVVADSIQFRRFLAMLFMGFAVMTGLLVMTGVYAMTAQLIVRRRFEMGIRIAVGASSASLIYRWSLKMLKPVVLGVLIGTVCSAFVARLLAHLLYQVPVLDMLVYGLAATLFCVAALLAILIPSLQIPGLKARDLLVGQ